MSTTRKLCPMCEAFGAGPCGECDALNRKPRGRRNPHRLLSAIAKAHRRAEEFYNNSKQDPHGINTALMVMHADTAKIYETLSAAACSPKP